MATEKETGDATVAKRGRKRLNLQKEVDVTVTSRTEGV